MWTCPNCHTQNEDSSRFCVECGGLRPAQQSYAPPQQGYAQPQAYSQPQTYTQPQQAYSQPQAYTQSQQGYTQPQAYTQSQQGYTQPQQGWSQAQPDYSQPQQYWAAPPEPPKKSRWWIWLVLGIVVLAAVGVTCFFTIHRWVPATCTAPETCSICRKTRGLPLGHNFKEATCTEPETCTRCGAKQGEALGHDPSTVSCTEDSVCRRCGELLQAAQGHDWAPATYDAPETCTRCGLERGEVKGFIGDLEGTVSTESLYLYADNESHAYVLKTPVNRCRRLSFSLSLTEVDGNPYGTWAIYGRDLQGNWTRLGTFTVQNSAFNNWVTYDFDLTGEPSFDALTALPLSDENYSISYSFYYDAVQVSVD